VTDCYQGLACGGCRVDDWLTRAETPRHPTTMTSLFTVITTLDAETIVWQLVAITAAAAINTALEFTGPGATLIRCTKESDW
jgi:hypothetical protein